MGKNGAGKTTLLKMVAGVLTPDEGEVRLGASLKMGYFAQQALDVLDPDLTLIEQLQNDFPREGLGALRTLVGAFQFSGDDVDKKIRALSGGEKSRLVMARMLFNPPNFLVLDEPTNHLDLATKEMLVEALKSFDGTMLFVSHDRMFLRGLGKRVLELGGESGIEPGAADLPGHLHRIRGEDRARSPRHTHLDGAWHEGRPNVAVSAGRAETADVWAAFVPGPEESVMSEPQEEDFATMFEASLQAKRVTQGQTVEGTIVRIGAEVALVDVGGKSEAVIDVGELKDADGTLEVAVGDRIEAVVVSTTGGVQLSRKLIRGAATDRQLEDAFRAGLPVEGTVEKTVKGGYEVRVARQRAFCPMSQIDIVRTADPEVHVGHVYTFRIVEYKDSGRDGGKDLVVSRRALLEEEQRANADEVRRSDRRRRRADRARGLGPGVRRLRRPGRRRSGAAPRLGDGVVPRRGHLAGRHARRGDHREGAARGGGRTGRSPSD